MSFLPATQFGRVQFGGPLVEFGFAGLGQFVAISQFFEQALVARLKAIPELVALLGLTASGGAAIFKTFLPQTYDLGTRGPALTYSVPDKPMGHVLTGSDGTAVATTSIDVWSYGYGLSKMVVETIADGIDGPPIEYSWGDGTCLIVSVVQQDESDDPVPPKAGTDQWIYHISCDYRVMYRVGIPTLL